MAWHGEDYRVQVMLFVVVPFQGEAEAEVAVLIDFDGVAVLERFDEVVGILFVDVFHAKIVDYEGEGNGAGGVFEEALCEWAWEAAFFG